MLNLHYNELIGSNEEWKGKEYLIVDDYTLDKVLDKIERIGMINLEDNKIMISTDDKFSDDITLKNSVMLMTCVINDDGICSSWNIHEHKNLCLRTRYNSKNFMTFFDFSCSWSVSMKFQQLLSIVYRPKWKLYERNFLSFSISNSKKKQYLY